MSILKKHVGNLRKEVRGYYTRYRSAQAKVEEAEQAVEEAKKDETDTKARNGGDNIHIEIAAHNTKHKQLLLQAAKDNLKKVADERFSLLNTAKKIRENLSAELDDIFSADPQQVDSGTITLLTSGVLQAVDYEKMYYKAKKAGNFTMCRLIGKAAGDFSEKVQEAEDRRKMNVVFADSLAMKKDTLAAYDEHVFLLKRATGNPQSVYSYQENPVMFDVFLEITEDTAEEED